MAGGLWLGIAGRGVGHRTLRGHIAGYRRAELWDDPSTSRIPPGYLEDSVARLLFFRIVVLGTRLLQSFLRLYIPQLQTSSRNFGYLPSPSLASTPRLYIARVCENQYRLRPLKCDIESCVWYQLCELGGKERECVHESERVFTGAWRMPTQRRPLRRSSISK